MKIGLSLNNYNETLKNLRLAGFQIKNDFKADIIDYGGKIRDRAKQILAEESKRRTNQRYWTGRLHDSIESRITQRDDEIVGISVGPDSRRAPYAEWVEIGHYIVSGPFGAQRGPWWEGYHYMERAFTEIAPEIPNQIANTLSVSLTKFDQGRRTRRTRHRTTGRFVKGFTTN